MKLPSTIGACRWPCQGAGPMLGSRIEALEALARSVCSRDRIMIKVCPMCGQTMRLDVRERIDHIP